MHKMPLLNDSGEQWHRPEKYCYSQCSAREFIIYNIYNKYHSGAQWMIFGLNVRNKFRRLLPGVACFKLEVAPTRCTLSFSFQKDFPIVHAVSTCYVHAALRFASLETECTTCVQKQNSLEDYACLLPSSTTREAVVYKCCTCQRYYNT